MMTVDRKTNGSVLSKGGSLLVAAMVMAFTFVMLDTTDAQAARNRSRSRAAKARANRGNQPTASPQSARPVVPDEGDQPNVDISEFDFVDPKKVINPTALRRTLVYFKMHRGSFDNQRYIAVIDYTKLARERRFCIFSIDSTDLKNRGKVACYLTAHGKGSDPQGTGRAVRFSNREGSEASSVGYFRSGEVYYGSHGRSMRLEGLSKTNSNALERLVVIHPARYVSESDRHAGRSWGCPAIDPAVHDTIINRLRGQALIYAYGGKLASASSRR